MLDNVVALFGMPRSGTTIVSRLIANHSRIQAIIEPYHSRRETGYRETDVLRLCSDFHVPETQNASLLVKETFTRSSNAAAIGELMNAAAASGIRTAHIFVLRSPLECFLSQVEATTTFWAKATKFGYTERSLRVFWNTFCESLKIYFGFGNRYHRRFVVYDRFVAYPAAEIGSATALFGYALEPSQMNLKAEARDFGGDPKARARQTQIIPEGDRFRSGDVAAMSEKFRGLSEFRSMQGMHELIKAIAREQPASEEIIRDLAALAYRGSL